MIKSWMLENFKSAGRRTTLDFAPLTVFAGPNSSGKSTIIQSILLTAQTLQSAVIQRPIILNGHMARLGSFTDIVTGADEEDDVTIGFELSLDPESMYRPSRSGVWRDLGPYWFAPHAEPASVHCEFTFSMRGPLRHREALKLQPRLERSYFRAVSQEQDDPWVAEMMIERSEEEPPERLEMLGVQTRFLDSTNEPLLRFSVSGLVPGDVNVHGRDAFEKVTIAGASLRHFLPNYVLVAYDAVETEVRRVVDSLTAKGTLSWRALDEDIASILNQTAVRSVVEAVLGDFREQQLENPQTISKHRLTRGYLERIRDLVDRARGAEGEALEHMREMMIHLPPVLRGELAGLFAEREESLANAVRRGRKPRFELAVAGLPDRLAAAVSGTGRYFTGQVQYLGPLRDEPKAIYPLAGAADPADVGLRGEHTAAVLDVHRNTIVDTVDPSYFSQDVAHLPRVVQRPLIEATLEWLEYMGVGTGLTTEDRGKLGHELKVGIGDGVARHDLTQVGVGVSQVLPILVLSLLSEAGATLIFEQPELHLHPKVQTRLGDFFVALTMMRKQCIVETHSEYLINQLRYRAVISEGDIVSSKLGLFFVEKHGSQSNYRPVHISSYGVIEDWPTGFFDEKERTASKIMRAAMEKRLK